MDFNFSPEEEALCQEVRTWLQQNLPQDFGPEDIEAIGPEAYFDF